MTPKFFIGIDISKLTLDIAVLQSGDTLQQYKIDNTEKSVRQLLVTLKSDFQCMPANSIYCAEQMGLYATFLLNVLLKKKVRICLEPPLQIKLSLGIQRVKNDALDALLIARYAYKNHSTLKFWQPPRQAVEQLKGLSSLRRRLIKIRGMLQQTKNLEDHFLSVSDKRRIAAYSQRSLAAIKADIKNVEDQIDSTIEKDQPLKDLVRIMTSVQQIGKVIATEMIIRTNEFQDIASPKRFASYCGIAPFAKTSGTSLMMKPRVSGIANKEMKKLLHMAALGATRPGQSKFRTYYVRKVAEGKNKMSVLNAVRNKLVQAIFACVRDNKLYEEST